MLQALEIKLAERAFNKRELIVNEITKFMEAPGYINKFKPFFSLKDTIIKYDSYAYLLKSGAEDYLIAEDFGGDWDSHPVQFSPYKQFTLISAAEGWSYDKESKTIELKQMLFDESTMEWDTDIIMPPVCLAENIKDQILTWTDDDREAISETIDCRLHWFCYYWTKYFLDCYQEKKMLKLIPSAPYWLSSEKEFNEETVFKRLEDHYRAMMSLISDNQRRANGKNKCNGDL